MKAYILILLLTVALASVQAQNYSVQSPSGRLTINVTVDENISYSVSLGNREIITPSPISLFLEDEILGRKMKVRKSRTISVSEEIVPVVARKNNRIPDVYNQLILSSKGFNLHFRAYDEGVAYRWEVTGESPIKVINEQATFTFADDHQVWFPEEESMFSHQERSYLKVKLSEITPRRFASTGLTLLLNMTWITLFWMKGGTTLMISCK